MAFRLAVLGVFFAIGFPTGFPFALIGVYGPFLFKVALLVATIGDFVPVGGLIVKSFEDVEGVKVPLGSMIGFTGFITGLTVFVVIGAVGLLIVLLVLFLASVGLVFLIYYTFLEDST